VQNAAVAKAIQAKMDSVQALLAQAIQNGQTSASDIAKFAAQVGANATALQQLVNAMQSGSSDGLATIAKTSSESINNLKSQVKAQLDSANGEFNSGLDSQRANLGALIQSMQNDLQSQSGEKTGLLVQKRDFLQGLYAQLTSGSVARSQASKELDTKFTEIQNQVSAALPDLTSKIAAQQARVTASLKTQRDALAAAMSQVNQTIADTNKTALSELSALQAQGKEKVDAVQSALDDSTGAVSMMIERYKRTMQQYLEQDNTQRVQENAVELSRIMGVNATLVSSQEAQNAAYANRTAVAQNRAAQIAQIMGDLSGASTAAKAGQAAFQTYIQDLARDNGLSMATLVSAMRDQAANQTSSLSQMLSSNGLFVNRTLDALAADAALLQQGAVDGSTDVLANIQGSLLNADRIASGQQAKLSDLSTTAGSMVAITGQELTQLMTILLAQNQAQAGGALSQYQAALNQTANVQTAVSMYTDAMNQATQADIDALNEATATTDQADATAQALINAAIETATNAAKSQTDQADADYIDIQNAINAAEPIIAGFQQRLDAATQTFETEKPQIEAQVTDLQGSVNKLQDQVSANQQAQMDRVNNWITEIQAATLKELSDMQNATVANSGAR
jgi:hypothetical protein